MRDVEKEKLKQAFTLVSEVEISWSRSWERFDGTHSEEVALAYALDLLADVSGTLRLLVGPLPQTL